MQDLISDGNFDRSLIIITGSHKKTRGGIGGKGGGGIGYKRLVEENDDVETVEQLFGKGRQIKGMI